MHRFLANTGRKLSPDDHRLGNGRGAMRPFFKGGTWFRTLKIRCFENFFKSINKIDLSETLRTIYYISEQYKKYFLLKK